MTRNQLKAFVSAAPFIGVNDNWFINNRDTGVKAVGEPGSPGVTPRIGACGYWHIGNENTGIRAYGIDGITPHIGANGNWWIGDEDTRYPASGGFSDAPLTGAVLLKMPDVMAFSLIRYTAPNVPKPFYSSSIIRVTTTETITKHNQYSFLQSLLW